ncbi:MAG TPA: serine hydrolase domain-containing protein [Dehalococcoidia bacterium]|jgi:CubicO group peptidase (beta-lactamase class C family)
MTTTDTAVNAKVRELVERQLAEGQQLGVQVSAYLRGEPIIDVCAGQMGPDDARPVRPDTLFNCFSTTKGVAATALHILADRGQIDYEAPVAKYWPEFAANGKERVTVAQAMSHQAGLYAMPADATVDFLTDWQAGLDWVANGTPVWEPGTATGYHAITYAWIVGGIVQGATGRHIQNVIREEIALPLGLQDELFVGIPDGVEDRLAVLKVGPRPEQPIAMPPDHPMFKAMPANLGLELFNDLRVRRACLPSANGHFSARALARTYATLANGGQVDGVRLVSPERIAIMQRVLTSDVDRVLMLPIPKGVGYMMGGPRDQMPAACGPRVTAFGHDGAGGSTAFADPEVGLSVAVVPNLMQMTLSGEGPTQAICDLIRAELGVA